MEKVIQLQILKIQDNSFTNTYVLTSNTINSLMVTINFNTIMKKINYYNDPYNLLKNYPILKILV
jgi:hypothetical protein